MEQHDESQGAGYPRGRGYGNDYLRGGEVLGGYGYDQRADYARPRGEQQSERRSGSGDVERPEFSEGGDAADDEEERFPQDERAGGWEIPHDLNGEGRRAAPSSEPGEGDDAANAAGPDIGAGAPVPEIEHTYGASGGNLFHSRSYYVTQAQLQQRFYGEK
jgi:hypothetical protein